MNNITDKYHIKILKEKNLIIQDTYLKKQKKLVRSSDGLRLDQVYNAPKIEKKFIYNDKCIYVEKDFDKTRLYTFATYNKDNKVKCSNCGYTGDIIKFYDGCPHCSTDFNIDYGLKKYGIKSSFDSVGLLMFILIFIVIGYIFLTKYGIFNNDLFFCIVGLVVIVVCFIAYYFNKNKSIKLETGEIDLNQLINCLIYDLNLYYYRDDKEKNLIDFEILNYITITDKEKKDNLFVNIKYTVRKYYLINGEIIKKRDINKAVMIKNKKENLNSTVNIRKCSNCGAPIDILKDSCEFCRTKINETNKINEWILEKVD